MIPHQSSGAMRGAASAALALALIASLGGAAATTAREAPASRSAGAPPEPQAEQRADAKGDSMRRPEPRGEGMRARPDAPIPPEMIERILEVARDVSPELAQQIEARRDSSPEELSQAIRQNARRLFALSVLKQRSPDLYRIRVEDLRLQMELRTLGEQFRAAETAGDSARAEDLAGQIAAKARAQVEVDLRARAEELVALDQQLKVMREELRTEQGQTDVRTAERIDAVKKGLPIKQRGIFGGEDERGRGEGDPRGSGDRRGRAPGGKGPGGGAGGAPGAPDASAADAPAPTRR